MSVTYFSTGEIWIYINIFYCCVTSWCFERLSRRWRQVFSLLMKWTAFSYVLDYLIFALRKFQPGQTIRVGTPYTEKYSNGPLVPYVLCMVTKHGRKNQAGVQRDTDAAMEISQNPQIFILYFCTYTHQPTVCFWEWDNRINWDFPIESVTCMNHATKHRTKSTKDLIRRLTVLQDHTTHTNVVTDNSITKKGEGENLKVDIYYSFKRDVDYSVNLNRSLGGTVNSVLYFGSPC